MSFDWKSLATSTLAFTLTPQTFGVAGGYALPSMSYKFGCSGALAPAATPTTGNKVSASWKDGAGTEILKGETAALETLIVMNAAAVSTFTITLSKKEWNIPGAEAIYTFLFKYTGTASYGPGSWVFIEFSRGMAPKLSRSGVFRCA